MGLTPTQLAIQDPRYRGLKRTPVKVGSHPYSISMYTGRNFHKLFSPPRLSRRTSDDPCRGGYPARISRRRSVTTSPTSMVTKAEVWGVFSPTKPTYANRSSFTRGLRRILRTRATTARTLPASNAGCRFPPVFSIHYGLTARSTSVGSNLHRRERIVLFPCSPALISRISINQASNPRE